MQLPEKFGSYSLRLFSITPTAKAARHCRPHKRGIGFGYAGPGNCSTFGISSDLEVLQLPGRA